MTSTAGRRRASRPAERAPREPAADQPVARIAVDVPLAHLDRPFDYLVTDAQALAAQPGVRVRVRFAGQLVDGIVLERVDRSDHEGRLAFVERVLGAEPVLSAEIAALARAVADRYAGTLADVLRLAVPPRHATAERAASRPRLPGAVDLPELGALDRYAGGAELLAGLVDGAPRRVWEVLPGGWPAELASAVAATVRGGRGALVVVPDARDVARVESALHAALGREAVAALTADLGPAERYRRFLAVSRGVARVVVGTRAAVWAPVDRLGLVVVWDDGDDLHAEPRAPYCHVREVAVLRAHLAYAALVLAGHAITAEGAQLVESGWAEFLEPASDARRRDVASVRAAGGDDELAGDVAARAARLPTIAWRTAHDALRSGPVLVQVPRRGYQPGLACAHCRSPARCTVCGGPLARPAADRPPVCRWCGVVATAWSCRVCGGESLRAVVVGVRRTAEELGRAFPGVPVRTSGGSTVLDVVDDRPALVIATPGAEPVADGGYTAAVLLDGWLLVSRPDLRAGEEAVRRWMGAAALVRGGAAGGRVVVVAPGELRPVQALVRWQPRWHAERELDDRRALHLPPVARMAALTGTATAVGELIEALDLPPGAELFGPVPALRATGGSDGAAEERMLVRVPRVHGAQLAATIKAAQAGRSARKAVGVVRVEIDPVVLG